MAKTFLLIGRSGTGKSYSMHSLPENDYAIISVLGKELPFKTDKKFATTDDYATIKQLLMGYAQKGVKNIIIDDAGYLMTNQFMNAQSGDKSGNKVFELFSKIGTDFFHLIRTAQLQLPDDVVVGFTMHTDKNEFGDVKPKTIGRMLDEKVSIEGLFSIVLEASKINNKYVFKTQTDGTGVTKSPFGMFESDEVPNDMALVINNIRDYYNINIKEEK